MSSWFEVYGRSEVAPELLTGAHPRDVDDVAALRADGVTVVVNLCDDEEYPPGARSAVEAGYAASGMTEHRLASIDYGGLSPELLDAGVATVGAALDVGERVYLHCRAGWQRSATVAAAVLVTRDGIDPDHALAEIRRRRPDAQPLPHQVADLHRWWRDAC